MTKSNLSTRLNCEQLETRENPDGNVSVSIINGGIVIVGDAASNWVSLQQNAFGDVFVFGFGNTLVNGQTAIFLGRGIPGDVQIFLGDGNDRTEVIGVRAASVLIASGTGFDQNLVLNTATIGGIGVLSGDQDDITFLSVVSASHIILDGGFGFDRFHVDNTFTRNGLFLFNQESQF